jgi:hypothetical protein
MEAALLMGWSEGVRVEDETPAFRVKFQGSFSIHLLGSQNLFLALQR